jgi:adenine-specific DNA-methyltransferase
MPILNWIGKDAVVNHDKKVPFRLLKNIKSKSVGDSENLIIEGDNLEALKALLPHYQNKIKCIYIDPPYNTGNEGWAYNDNVDSPIMKKWLKELPVHVDDLNRHDKWLCMVYPRLKILKELLREDGVIFISIDDNEQANLKKILDEIFGGDNFLAKLVWNTEGATDNQLEIKIVHEYIYCYVKNISLKNNAISKVIDPSTKKDSKVFRKYIENSIIKNGSGNPVSSVTLPVNFPCEIKELKMGKSKIEKEYFKKVKNLGYVTRELTAKYKVDYPIRFDPLIVKNGLLVKPCRVLSGWANANKLKTYIENDCKKISDSDDAEMEFYLSKRGVIIYRKERINERHILSVIKEVGTTNQARSSLEKMGITFPFPKPLNLIKYLIEIGSKHDDIILDSFAGSGTTGHAVLELNKKDKVNRKFILVELESEICKKITSERVKKVIKGYSIKNKKIEGIDGGFQYAVLDKKLFNSDGRINDECTFEELASYLYFTETKTILDTKKINRTLLDTHNETQIHLMFNGIGKNNLDRKFLSTLDKNKDKIIYADKCTLDDSTLEKHKTVFKQIPYEVQEF